MVNPNQQNQPDIETVESEDFRNIPVDMIFGGVKPHGLRATVITEERHPKFDLDKANNKIDTEFGKMVYKKQIALHLDPIQMKQVYGWLQQKINEYEDQFGEIEISEQERHSQPGSGAEFR